MFSGIFLVVNIVFVFYFFEILIWKSIFYNFKISKIYYEESSWFDTKLWQKPSFLIRKDILFANQKIKKKYINIYQKEKVFTFYLLGFLFFPILLSLLKSL